MSNAFPHQYPMKFKLLEVDGDSFSESDFETAATMSHTSGGTTKITLETTGGVVLRLNEFWSLTTYSDIDIEPDWDFPAPPTNVDCAVEQSTTDDKSSYSSIRCHAEVPLRLRLLTQQDIVDGVRESQCDEYFVGVERQLALSDGFLQSIFSTVEPRPEYYWFNVSLSDMLEIRLLEQEVELIAADNLKTKVLNIFTNAELEIERQFHPV